MHLRLLQVGSVLWAWLMRYVAAFGHLRRAMARVAIRHEGQTEVLAHRGAPLMWFHVASLGELEQAILCIPFDFAHEILNHLTTWLNAGQKVELTCKIAALVMRLHANSFGRTPETRRTLVKLRPLLRAKEARDLMGFNLAGLNVLDAFIRDNEEVKDDLVDDDAGL